MAELRYTVVDGIAQPIGLYADISIAINWQEDVQ